MGTYFAQADLDRLRDLRAVLIGIEDRPEGTDAPRYWADAKDIELYDRIFAARIGWKWDAAIDEVARRRGLPEAKTLLDWAAGTGVATRRVLARIPSIERVVLFDRDQAVLDYARRSIEQVAPNVTIETTTVAPNGAFDLAVASHVLDELDGHGLASLAGSLRAAHTVLWVEPGSKRTSRRLSAARDSLLDGYNVVAPCTHSGSCGMLAPDRKRDWCHLFAKPPAEVHTTGQWSEIHRELRIDLRSLPYSFIALERRAAETAQPEDAARLLGRPRFQRGRVLLDLCDAGGVRESQMLQRTDKAFFKELKKGVGELLLLREGDGVFERVPPSVEDRA